MEKRNIDRHLCKTCQYRAGKNYECVGINCNYIEITGEMRGCEADDCTKYKEGKIKHKNFCYSLFPNREE